MRSIARAYFAGKRSVDDLGFAGDYEEIQQSLDVPIVWQKSSPTRFRMVATSYGIEQSRISGKTVAAALKKGHTDVDLWMYVNGSRSFYSKGRRTWCSIDVGCPHYVIDIDNTPHASSIPEMVKYLKTKNLPIPRQIVQTGERNFHFVMASGRIPLVLTWTYALIVEFCMSFSGVSDKTMDSEEVRNAFKESGVDWGYLSQQGGSFCHAMARVPGSVNSKTGFICKGWMNPDYATPETVQLIQNLTSYMDSTFHLSPSEQKIQQQRNIPAWTRGYIDNIADKIHKHSNIQVRYTKALAEWLCSNFTYLKAGNLRISQTRLGRDLGVSQPQAGRILRELVDKQILSITKDYIKKLCPRTYAWGEAVQNIVAPQQPAKPELIDPNYRYTNAYEEGNTHMHYLDDIRRMFLQSYTKEEAVRFLRTKFEVFRPPSHRRSEDRIALDFEEWARKFRESGLHYRYWMAKHPPIPIEELIRQLA